eukprot:TRINITY_DN5538_c0_g1_i1.p2 TRINITY_DN5538_c0_g1~~TRINITY_DN5538_c0_g1_i1.p2  ORF type:complete len:205 (-),score=41.20 TRINITY_DN5538_c0_g1_i1:174-788(-)
MRMSTQQTNVSFQISDGTGAAEVRMWLEADPDSSSHQEASKWREGAYIRVVGHPRCFMHKRSIVAFQIHVVEDFNEITHHILSCIYVHLYNTKGPLNSTKREGGAGNLPVIPGVGGGGYGASPYSNANIPGGSQQGMSNLQQTILDIIARTQSNEGAHIDAIVREVVSMMPGQAPAEIRSTVDFLSAEGHLYSTVDDEHFKSAD